MIKNAAKNSRSLISRRLWGVCIFSLCLLLLSACEEIEEEKPWIQVERPQMLFTDTTLLDSYDKNILSWKLKTAYLERWADKEIVLVRPVLVDIYDSLGERVAFLRADSGSLDMKFTYVYAYGHVYALTPKGASVRADSLLWNKKDNLVKTESYVRVVSEDGDVLQGKGFESDAKMDHWRILSNVTGIFQDAAKRLKEEDKKQATELEQRSDSTSKKSTGNPPPSPKGNSTATALPSPGNQSAKQPPNPSGNPPVKQLPTAAVNPAPQPGKQSPKASTPVSQPRKPRRGESARPAMTAEDSIALEENKAAREKLRLMREARKRALQGNQDSLKVAP